MERGGGENNEMLNELRMINSVVVIAVGIRSISFVWYNLGKLSACS